jgi:hypothetical protein
MKRIEELGPLCVSTVLALAVAVTFPLDPILLPEAPSSARLTLSTIVFLLVFSLLLPFWLPRAIPSRAQRARRITALGCGLILVSAAFALCVYMIALAVLNIWLSCVALATGAVGICHLTQHCGKETR